MTNRREFLEHVGASAMLGALPLAVLNDATGITTPAASQGRAYDFSWTEKLDGKRHRALFDCTEVESGYGVWRASIWAAQYREHLGAQASDMMTVLVLRHNAVTLALRQELWDAIDIGTDDKVTHPVTSQPTTKNPALLSSARNEVAASFDAFALPAFLSRGNVALACHLALQDVAGRIAKKAGVSAEEAERRAVAALVPGVVLMPSGVIACVRAEEAGCHYVKGS